MLARLSLVILIAGSVSLWATETSRLSLPPEYQRGDITKPQGWWPLIGVGMGVMDAGEQVRSGGVPTHVKILGSYYFDSTPWVADAGVGLHNEFLTQDGAGSDTIQSFYSEFSARYQLTNRWQLGAIWNTLVDNPQRYKSNNDNLVSFVGAQVLKEFNWNEQYLVRAGGRVMTDVGIGGETINSIMGELQVSFGGARQTAMAEPPKAAPVIESVSLAVPETTPAPVAPHLARAASQSFKLEPGPIHFESESSELVFGSEPYLRRLAHALSLNRQLFDKIEIVAHATTPKGSAPLSKKLSASRADVIARQFVAAGMNEAQVKTVAESSRMSSSTRAKGRVELRFSGVKNETALRNILNSVAR